MANNQLIIVSTLFFAISLVHGLTPLEEFVSRPDQGISYFVNHTFNGDGYKVYALNFTSLNWLQPPLTDKPRWNHMLYVCVPTFVTTKTAFLYIQSPYSSITVPNTTTLHPMADSFCKNSNSITAVIDQVGNAPLVQADGVSRAEDTLMAWSWATYMQNTSNTEIINNFPITKAVVRAMDAVQSFTKTALSIRVKDFVVAGPSKRGLAAWLAAVTDTCVKAIVPLVAAMLHTKTFINNHVRAYGGFSFAFYDYFLGGVTAMVNHPQFDALHLILWQPSLHHRLLLRAKHIPIPKLWTRLCQCSIHGLMDNIYYISLLINVQLTLVGSPF
ncbi:hypothetical protein SAMD00019534_033850 [Acytostelium subglobosum LB1]|uniref:hypothetical protein n=1 Tax=Acytostelium subglobosum LB1 TaxID=1410327 RepID=UPI000644FAC5|nr:hypothetical protein SAMD00019534_033850 [Acytostelium subglobosum LB1]GAM20210.1 hypothetical protein SAMD00019534_033850 [Acytostelium subglobosum LB1]|eukprot:XP_012759731.1 hypothetical protein SAMD00019534_033850 [Acytostelium subglobosum LB1]